MIFQVLHFRITEKREDLKKFSDFLPAVHKLASGGYDGRGVQILESEKDLHLGFDQPSVLEKKVNIHKEISQIIAINACRANSLLSTGGNDI